MEQASRPGLGLLDQDKSMIGLSNKSWMTHNGRLKLVSQMDMDRSRLPSANRQWVLKSVVFDVLASTGFKICGKKRYVKVRYQLLEYYFVAKNYESVCLPQL